MPWARAGFCCLSPGALTPWATPGVLAHCSSDTFIPSPLAHLRASIESEVWWKRHVWRVYTITQGSNFIYHKDHLHMDPLYSWQKSPWSLGSICITITSNDQKDHPCWKLITPVFTHRGGKPRQWGILQVILSWRLTPVQSHFPRHVPFHVCCGARKPDFTPWTSEVNLASVIPNHTKPANDSMHRWRPSVKRLAAWSKTSALVIQTEKMNCAGIWGVGWGASP